MAAMREAVRTGHGDVALGILSGDVRAYIRSPNSKCGWQVNDWDKPVPEGTEAVVLVDAYLKRKPVFHIIPVKAYRKIVQKVGPDSLKARGGRRSVNQGSRHCYVKPEDVVEYKDAWKLASAR
jgi:hypothetical protein